MIHADTVAPTIEPLVVGRVGAAAGVAWTARVATPAPWIVVVGPRRRLVGLSCLTDHAPGEIEQIGDRHHRGEEDRPELHCSMHCRPGGCGPGGR
jgi:hypothetical protein